jgi:hypothetical protein
MAAIVVGIAVMVAVHVATGGRGWRLVNPALAGITAAIAAWAISLSFGSGALFNGKRTVRT